MEKTDDTKLEILMKGESSKVNLCVFGKSSCSRCNSKFIYSLQFDKVKNKFCVVCETELNPFKSLEVQRINVSKREANRMLSLVLKNGTTYLDVKKHQKKALEENMAAMCG